MADMARHFVIVEDAEPDVVVEVWVCIGGASSLEAALDILHREYPYGLVWDSPREGMVKVPEACVGAIRRRYGPRPPGPR